MTKGCQLRTAGAPPRYGRAMDNPPQEVTVRVVRVFTRNGSGGNHLGIHDGLLPDDVMRTVATSLGILRDDLRR